MILIRIDRDAGAPAYLQIVRQIRHLIDDNVLKPGAKLPSTRALAETLGLNRSTVYEAYQELWALGFIESHPGSYARVRERVRIAGQQDRLETGSIKWDSIVSPASKHVYAKMLAYNPGSKPDTPSSAIDLSELDLDDRLFPMEEFGRCIKHVLARNGKAILHYGDYAGYGPLRQYIAERCRIHGLSVEADEVLITNGSNQAIDLVFRLLAGPGQTVAIESPTYSNVIPLLGYHQCSGTGIPMREEGMDLAYLRRALTRRRPVFLYTIPNFQNPTGITTSQAHREELLSVCEEFRLPLVEDGFEEEMKYFGKVPLPIKSMDKHQVVIYLGTFSKVLFPGVRVGWVIAERECIRRLMAIKRFSDISTSPLIQAALHEFCRREHFDVHVRRMHRVFRKRMQAALAAARECLPAEHVAWTEPSGGYLIWVKFKDTDVDESRFHLCCRENRVSVSPGRFFFSTKSREKYFRISISMLNETEIWEGIDRLGRAIRQTYA